MEIGRMDIKMWFPILSWFMICSHVTLAVPSKEFGVCYGMIANNLPQPNRVADLIQGCHIAKLRLYEPHPEIMRFYPNILMSIGTRNEDLPKLATNPEFAKDWVNTNYVPYGNILDIVVGNEVIPGPLAKYVVPAMRNIRAALEQTKKPEVMVTTAISSATLTNTYPPSQSTFTPDSVNVMTDLVQYIRSLEPGYQPSLYIHVYPYFAYASDPNHVSFDYAMFQAKSPVVQDGNLAYYNLFDSMYDGFVWALEKIGGKSVGITVGETGWPTAGNGKFTSAANAFTYNTNLYNHNENVKGSPKRPNGFGDVYVFSLFNENLKPEGVERNWGLFYPNMEKVYASPLCQ